MSANSTDLLGLLDLDGWRAAWTPARWRTALMEPADEGCRRRFWRAASTGRPLAEDRWRAKLESKLGIRLRPNPVGRPRKAKPKPAKRKQKKA